VIAYTCRYTCGSKSVIFSDMGLIRFIMSSLASEGASNYPVSLILLNN